MKKVAGTLRIDLASYRELKHLRNLVLIWMRQHKQNSIVVDVQWKF
jgi:F0F1-type ATP synthase alpha subunit